MAPVDRVQQSCNETSLTIIETLHRLELLPRIAVRVRSSRLR